MMVEKRFSAEELGELPSRFRAHLCNCLPGFKSVNLVGTRNRQGINNLAIFSQVVHIGANPSYLGIVFRPHTVRRDTLENILDQQHFTINHIRADFYKAAHQTAAKYNQGKSEFEEVGLTPEFTEMLSAPYVKESTIKIGLTFNERVDIKSNNTLLLVGKTLEVRVPEEHLKTDGYLDLAAAGTITSTNLDAYHRVQKLGRLAYAEPGKEPEELPSDLF